MMRDDTKKRIVRGAFRGTTAAMLVAFLGACQNGTTLTRAQAEENDINEGMQLADFADLLQTAPDEFSVLTKRPLEMPDSFAALPAPNPGAPSSRDFDPQADARAALAFDTGAGAAPGRFAAPSASEAAILASAGAADPSIRATLLDEQAEYDRSQDIYILDRVFPKLRELRGGANPEAINAEAERQRLLQAGVGPGRRAAVPASLPPVGIAPPTLPPLAAAPVDSSLVAAPVPSTPIDPGTGPALAGSGYTGAPTLGALAPEPADTTPSLIYLPE